MNGLINYENAYDYIDKAKYLHGDENNLKQISSSIFNKLLDTLFKKVTIK